MSKQVAWTKFIYETFCEEAMLSETERFIMRTRIEGWPVTKQAMHLNMSEANVHRIIRILKIKYDKVAANYWSLTCDFIDDPDATPHKVAKYFSM